MMIVLTAFSTLTLVFSLLGPDVLAPLQFTPAAARLGVFMLTIAFVALVWEKERQFRSLSSALSRQDVLITAFGSRMKVVEELLDATHRLSSPLAVDDVMTVVLDAAVELVGADNGRIQLAERDNDIALARTRTTGSARLDEKRVVISFPLRTERRDLGTLTLTFSESHGKIDDVTRGAIEHFAAQAASALEKADLLARERAAVAYLEAANAVKARFLNNISHELRTPLTSIIGFSSTLDRHWDELLDQERRDFIRHIEHHGHRLGTIVERLLDTSRAELQGVLVCPVLHDARQPIAAGVAAATDGMGEPRVALALPDRAVEADVDPFVLDQVVFNLVDNALRYTEGEIHVVLDAYENDLVIRVSDAGHGIDEHTLKAVTDPFYRFEEQGDSHGMGLHVVRMLVESHGGRGQIHSDPSGSQAVFSLPRFSSATASQRVLEALPH